MSRTGFVYRIKTLKEIKELDCTVRGDVEFPSRVVVTLSKVDQLFFLAKESLGATAIEIDDCPLEDYSDGYPVIRLSTLKGTGFGQLHPAFLIRKNERIIDVRKMGIGAAGMSIQAMFQSEGIPLCIDSLYMSIEEFQDSMFKNMLHLFIDKAATPAKRRQAWFHVMALYGRLLPHNWVVTTCNDGDTIGTQIAAVATQGSKFRCTACASPIKIENLAYGLKMVDPNTAQTTCRACHSKLVWKFTTKGFTKINPNGFILQTDSHYPRGYLTNLTGSW